MYVWLLFNSVIIAYLFTNMKSNKVPYFQQWIQVLVNCNYENVTLDYLH